MFLSKKAVVAALRYALSRQPPEAVRSRRDHYHHLKTTAAMQHRQVSPRVAREARQALKRGDAASPPGLSSSAPKSSAAQEVHEERAAAQAVTEIEAMMATLQEQLEVIEGNLGMLSLFT